MSSRAMIALLAGIVACSLAFGATPTPDRDEAVQERIAAVVSAVVDEPDAAAERVQDLRQSADGRRESLLVQLALFLADSDSTEEAMVGASLLQALEFTPEEKLAAVLPHLDAESASLRKVLSEILGTIDRPDGTAPDFGFYEPTLALQGREATAALIRYMYRVSPAAALPTMARVFGGGTAPPGPPGVDTLEALVAKHEGLLAWSDDDLDAAVEILDRLADDPSWWVRMYAASVMEKEPDLGIPSLRGRLAADRDALIRSVAGATATER